MSLIPIREPHADYHAPSGHWGGHGTMKPVRVVLHDTESHDATGVTDIEGVANFWIGAEARLGYLPGAHYMTDGDGNLGKFAELNQILNHVGGLNTGSVGIEQVGDASFTEADWLARPAQLEEAARLLAYLHVQYKIPLEVPAQQGPGKAMHGVMTHAMVIRFEPASEGHTDPGAGYPLAVVLKTARAYVAAGGWPQGGGTLTKQPPKKPRSSPVYQITYTKRNGHRHTIENHSPALWLGAHPRAKHRGDVVIHPIHKQKGPA